MTKRPVKMVDGREVDVTDADLAQMAADAQAGSISRHGPSIGTLRKRLLAVGKWKAFAVALMRDSPESLLGMLESGPNINPADPAVRAALVAVGADADAILA